MKFLWVLGFIGVVIALGRWVEAFEDLNVTEISHIEGYGVSSNPLMVGLTLIQGAHAKGAVCLDGTLPGYHLHRGYGSGANSWLIQLEGGGWCNTIRNCVYRKTTRRGSSKYMEKQLGFTGILSNKAEENPDFFNWNRVKLRYCDGASFTGDSQDEAKQLNFRGQKIWLAGMEELMAVGMRNADQALLSGCSAGGLASILHCDEFGEMFPATTKVKCLSDAGLFLDAADISGGRTLRNMFGGVVSLQGVQKSLPKSCTDRMDPTSCFFPQNLIANIKTPLFILNAAYDAWQLQASLAPPSVDPLGAWKQCKANHAHCSASQIDFLQDFRNQMLKAINGFSKTKQNGLFINSCFAHCQTERQDTWFGDDSPVLKNKGIAQSVGDWYFDRVGVKEIDCPYPCDGTCHNLVFNVLCIQCVWDPANLLYLGECRWSFDQAFTPVVREHPITCTKERWGQPLFAKGGSHHFLPFPHLSEESKWTSNNQCCVKEDSVGEIRNLFRVLINERFSKEKDTFGSNSRNS